MNVVDGDSLDGFLEGISVSLWVYPNGDVNSDQHIVHKLGVDDTCYIVSVRGDIATNRLDFGVENSVGTWFQEQEVGASLVSNEWNHIVLNWNLVTLKGYVNGIEIYSGIFNGVALQTTNINLQIGGSTYYTSKWFNGIIDEVRISNIARTAGWIETEYNNQSNVDSFMTIGAAEETFKLDITTAAKVITAGTESTAFTVQVDHNVAADTTINLSSDSSGIYYFAATPGGAEVSSVIIPSGTSSVDFYYTDYEVGSPTIVVAATNFVSDDQQQTVQRLKYQFSPGGSFEMQGKIKFE